jgi:DNA-binding CsgD family transcriptional regulator
MARPIDVLDRISKSDDAVFAFDANERVILWNKGCEALLGRPAYQVLGRHCYDIMCGRDIYGNRYCCPSCPAARQSREHPDDPVRRFELDVATASGGTRRVAVSMFSLPASRPALATLVHVMRPPEQAPSALESELESAVYAPSSAPVRPARAVQEGPLAALTDREREILKKLAQGMPTPAIAKQLFISPVTVRNHVAKILGKLEVHTKLAAVALAYQNGLIGPDEKAS